MQKKIKLSEKLMEKHGKIRYRFMNAYLFATVFQKNQETLKDLIAALLRIELKEIVSLEILNPILPGQDIDHKSCSHVVFDEYGSGISGRELYGARRFADRKGAGV